MSSTTESAPQADIDIMSAWNWNGTSYVPPVIDALIHKQFQKQVEEQPDSEAVCAWDGSLTYSELDWLSSALAGFLQETYNLGNGTLVPLCFEKSKWNVVSMLAILKSGCACVPMDPAHPMERMQTIFELLGSDFSYVFLSSLAAGRRLSVLNCRINDYEVEFLGIDQTFFDELDQEHFAYFHKQFGTLDQETNTPALVVFTSGSTGTPKGIVQEHRGYCSAAAYHGAALSYGTESRIFQFAAHTFDVSLCDILTTLIHGGCICIPSDEERMNDLSGAFKRLRANHLPFTPTVATMIRPEDVLPEVKWMTLGGEALSREAMNIWADHVNLIQAYGPAEAGVDCTVRQNVKKEDSPNNLGRPIGSSIWIVNPENHDQLVPIGTEGELLIEGPIVARGYLGNDALTDKSFITDPEWVQLTEITSGRRFYKTGDLGFFAPNGDIHIVGRNDSQVKLRGQRLEIGEVEHHLRVAVGGSAQIAVAAVTPNGGAKILAAFIAMNGSDADENHSDLLAVSPDQLEKFRDAVKIAKEQLKDNLPSYMLPTAYIPIQKIPLSASGKLERKHLCSLAEALTTRDFANFVGQAETVVDTVAPSTHHEEVLHKAWKESLSVETFGIEDNFFHLGGDSARAMILVSCLRNYGFALTLKQKIDVADVAPFSQVADRDEERNAIRLHAAKVCGVDINRVLDIFPITEMQERFFHGAYLGGPLSVWVYASRLMHDSARQMIFNITGDLDIRRFFKAWHSVNERHSILRTRFIQKKDTRQILQVVVDDPIHIWSSCDPLSEDFLQRDRRVKMTWGAPLIRITASQEHRWVVLTISHAIYDGFSLDLIFKEVKRENDQAAGAKPAIEMNHFMKYLGDGDKQAALAFWRNHFAGADVKPVVPHDRLDEETVQNVVKRATVKLDSDLPAGAPNRSMILQVSAALFLAHRLDCADIIFDNHLSGRTGTLPGVEVLVGPTLTSLATRVHIGRDADAPVRNILNETQNFMNTVSEHEHMGWWKLVQMDEFRELLHGAPLLNVMPSPDTTGRDLGLELKKTNSHNEAPYGVMATLVDDHIIELLVCSDKRCVPEAEVEKDLKRWQIALQQVWASCAQANEGELIVGDVFSRLQDLA